MWKLEHKNIFDSLKYMELLNNFNFKGDLILFKETNRFSLLMNVYYQEHSKTIIMNFGDNVLLLYQYDKNKEIKFIKKIFLTEKRFMLDMKIHDKNISMFETAY